jgi:hypothetical protein
MSGMLGAMATSSVSASRQADGCGGAGSDAGAACSAGLPFEGDACRSLSGFSRAAVGASGGRGFGNGTAAFDIGSAAGASAGRGIGSGTAARRTFPTFPRDLGDASLNRMSHGAAQQPFFA